MYPALATRRSSEHTQIGSRTSSRVCEHTTKSNRRSANGHGVRSQMSPCTQVAAEKCSGPSPSAPSSPRVVYGFRSKTTSARRNGLAHPPTSRTVASSSIRCMTRSTLSVISWTAYRKASRSSEGPSERYRASPRVASDPIRYRAGSPSGVDRCRTLVPAGQVDQSARWTLMTAWRVRVAVPRARSRSARDRPI